MASPAQSARLVSAAAACRSGTTRRKCGGCHGDLSMVEPPCGKAFEDLGQKEHHEDQLQFGRIEKHWENDIKARNSRLWVKRCANLGLRIGNGQQNNAKCHQMAI